MLFNLLQSGIDTTAAMTAAQTVLPQQQAMHFTFLEMAVKGGWLMIVLLILSIIALYIFGKKWWMIHKASQIDKYFMKDIRDYIHEGKIKSAVTLCSKFDSPSARLVEKGIERMGRPLPDIQTAVENTGNAEVSRLEKGLPMLATIAGGAPMIGFLGTVLGMVQAFFNMSQAGNNVDISLLSGGIYTAMITTVGGLIVGIVAYFGYNYLVSQISNIVFAMENTTMDFMDLLNEPEAEKAEAKETK
jgi:biopolymer transport protein ExbB